MEKYVPRLLIDYNSKIKEELKEKLNIENIMRVPKVKKIVLNKTFFWKSELISWIVWPEINEMYPGISGSTQGDKKLTIPAKKATKSETFIFLVFFL